MADLELTASLEDYLEVVYEIVLEQDVARVRDIAARLQVSPPSVTAALQALAERGLVDYRPYAVVRLTPAGRDVAAGVARRHDALWRFFTRVLGLPEDEAGDAACAMEHATSPLLQKRLEALVQHAEEHPESLPAW